MIPKPFKREGYFLTQSERATIRRFILENPHLTYEKIGERFGICNSTVHYVKKEPMNKEYYEKKISELTNQLTLAGNTIFKLQNKILRLERK
jgi:hypothetical protein